MLHWLRDISFVDAWKAVSIVLTGAFGILGLLKEFKHKKTNKVTLWGWVSLVGIIISTTLGLAAQLIESQNDAAKSLALARKSDKTLNNIERQLTRIEEPEFGLTFQVPCDTERYRAVCSRVPQRMDWQNGEGFSIRPLYARDRPTPPPYLMLAIRFFAAPQDKTTNTSDDIPRMGGTADLSYTVLTDNSGYTSLFAESIVRDDVVAVLVDERPEVTANDGKIKSTLDLPGATCVVETIMGGLQGLQFKALTMKLKGGETISMSGDEFRREEVGSRVRYIYHFPTTS